MGIRAPATATLTLTGVQLPAGALLGGGTPEIYAECVALARVAWSRIGAT